SPITPHLHSFPTRRSSDLPFLTPLEMSPFLCSGSWLFFFPVRAFCFYRKIFAPGCSRNDDSCHPRPTASPVLLAWSGAQPCGAQIGRAHVRTPVTVRPPMP